MIVVSFLGISAMLAFAACAPKSEQCSADLSVDCDNLSSSGNGSSSSTSSTSSTSSSGDGGIGSSGDGGSSGSTSSGDGGSSGSDGGSTSSGGTGAFAGAPAYSQGTAIINSKGGVHNTNEAARGLACLQCHVQGGQASNLQFFMGGTVYTNTAGTVAAGPGVEIRILDSTNKALSTYTDAYGNFAIQNGGSPPTFPLKVGVRNASTAVSMSATITSGNCAANGCHTGAGQARIHIP